MVTSPCLRSFFPDQDFSEMDFYQGWVGWCSSRCCIWNQTPVTVVCLCLEHSAGTTSSAECATRALKRQVRLDNTRLLAIREALLFSG